MQALTFPEEVPEDEGREGVGSEVTITVEDQPTVNR